MAPQTQKQWNVEGKEGTESLKFTKDAPVPQLGDQDVLVKFHAASLNYRDLIIPRGKYPFPQKDKVIPGSDGAGTVEAVGDKVTQFKVGDKVSPIFNQGHLAGSLNPAAMGTGVGGMIDGTLRQYGSYPEQGLVKIPSNLSFIEAATLPCAAVTAWNALYGLESRAVKAGDTVITQGTGGVSLFALQFAKAAGARVISTTSSAEKAETLKKLGADHVINYKEDSNWGETAKGFTPNKEGASHVVEVGGPTTLSQSLKAIKIDGVISIIGFLGGVKGEQQPSFLDCLNNVCTVRGVFVGPKLMFEEMNKAIEVNNIKPVVDKTVFSLEDLKDAYDYMWDQKHFGKVAIKIE